MSSVSDLAHTQYDSTYAPKMTKFHRKSEDSFAISTQQSILRQDLSSRNSDKDDRTS